MADVQAALGEHLHGMAAPFLFVGAGLSRRYANVEGWEDLLRHFAAMTSRQYEYFKASGEGDLPTVASGIAALFHELWWSDARFAESRAMWGENISGTEGALKVEVALHVSQAVSRLPTSGSLFEELELLKDAVIDGVITTNYDLILEHLFPTYKVFVGQDQLLFSNSQGVAEIYKIHGSCAAPESLVLTARDYERFEDRNPYLAAKLLTIFVEHPVVFLGYSLADRNIISILRSIVRCLTQENIRELQDRLIFVQWDSLAEPTISPHTIVVDGAIIAVQRVVVPDFSAVYGALSDLTRAFPARLLRRLKEQVYDLVLSNDQRGRLYVADIDDDTKESEIDVVFGVGMRDRIDNRGYVGLTRWDLIDDIIDGGNSYDAVKVVSESLPRLITGSANVPVFKYLRQAGALDESGNIIERFEVSAKVQSMADKIRGGLPASSWHREKAPEVLADVTGIADLQEKQGTGGVFGYGSLLSPDIVIPDELHTFLLTNKSLRYKSWEGSQYVKLACLYDWIVYGRQCSR